MIKSDNSRRYWAKPKPDPSKLLSPENRDLKPGDRVKYFKRYSASTWTKLEATFESFGSRRMLKAWIILDGERISVPIDTIERIAGQ